MSKKKVKLNLGCGIALLSGFVNVDNGFDYKQLKLKKGTYKFAKTPKNAEFERADILDLPFEDNYADYILCVNTIEHVKIYEVISALKEMYRVLKKGGKLTLMTTDFDDLVDMWNLLRKNIDKTNELSLPAYLEVAQIMFGNQAGKGDGEVHKVPFNASFLNLCLQDSGFVDYELSRHKRGTQHPVLDGYFKFAKKFVLRSDMFVVNAIK